MVFNLVVLNLFCETLTSIFIFRYCLILTWRRWIRSFLLEDKEFYIVHICNLMASDGLLTQWARASPVMVLTKLSWNIPFSAPEGAPQCNTRASQMPRPLAACRESAGSYNRLPDVLYVFEYKTQYFVIHAPYTRIVVFWHINNISQYIS